MKTDRLFIHYTWKYKNTIFDIFVDSINPAVFLTLCLLKFPECRELERWDEVVLVNLAITCYEKWFVRRGNM